VLGQARAVRRHTPLVRDDEDRLTGRIVELAAVYGRYGTPRITIMLHEEGWRVNHKRVERIWRREGLKVPRRQPKRGRLRQTRLLRLVTVYEVPESVPQNTIDRSVLREERFADRPGLWGQSHAVKCERDSLIATLLGVRPGNHNRGV
jgi:transposase InsO family protein